MPLIEIRSMVMTLANLVGSGRQAGAREKKKEKTNGLSDFLCKGHIANS